MKKTVGTSKQNVLNQAIDLYRYELSLICHRVNAMFPRDEYRNSSTNMWSKYNDGEAGIVVDKFLKFNNEYSVSVRNLHLVVREDDRDSFFDQSEAYVALYDKFLCDLDELDQTGAFQKMFRVGSYQAVRDILAECLVNREGRS